MTVEQRLEKLEQQNKRQRLGLLVLAVALCGVVSMGQLSSQHELKVLKMTKERMERNKKPRDYVRAIIENNVDMRDQGDLKVDGLRTDHIRTMGMVVSSDWYLTDGWAKVTMDTDNEHNGRLVIRNKEGDAVVTIGVDDYGNGEIGVWNRKGKGRIYDSK